MNLDNIDEKLDQLTELYFLAEKASNRMLIIDHELDLLSIDLEVYRKVMHKEHQDVIKLEKMSKHFLFAKILGDREHELEHERQEYLQSVLEYNAIAKEIKLLKFEKDILKTRADEKDNLKKMRDYYLKIKEQKIIYNKRDSQGVLIKMRAEIDRLKFLIKEIKEALEVAKIIKVHLKNTIYFLKSMDNFGTYKMAKMTYSEKQLLNKAIKEAIIVKVNIRKLDKEMADIYSTYELPSMHRSDAFIESFHQNLITDWVLKNQLKSVQASLVSGQEQLFRIISTLKHDQEKSSVNFDQLMEEKRKYILNLQ